MNPSELLIFKERKTEKEEAKPAEAAKEEKKREAEGEKARKEEKGDVLEGLKAKVEEHEEKARKEKEEKEARKEAAKEEKKREAEGEKARKAEISFEPRPQRQAKETKSEVVARESAGGLNCIWHPWRQAYAICNYCHRAFCFEDMVAEQGNYYCLEDMDTAIRSRIETASNRSLNMGVVAGGAYLIPVLIFIYAYNTELAKAVSYVASIGFIPFIYNPVYQYAFPIVGAAAAVLSFAVGLWLFSGSRKAFPGLAIGATTSAIFLYDYLSTFSVYDLAIGAAAFTALLLFSYSLSVYVPSAEEVIVPREEELAPQWSNVGRF